MVEMINPNNDFGFFNADMVFWFHRMFGEGWCARVIVSNVSRMFTDSLLNRPTCLCNVGDTTGAGNKVNPFRFLRVNRVLNGSKGNFNGIERFEWRRDITHLKNMGNPICGSLDIREMNLRDRIRISRFNPRCFFGSEKGLEVQRSVVPIIFKTSRRWDFPYSRWLSSETLRAWVARVLRTPNFWDGKWWELAWRYWSVWVFFLKTWWQIQPSSLLERRMSRKGRQPFSSTSIVNLMESDWELMWLRNRSCFSLLWDQMT